MAVQKKLPYVKSSVPEFNDDVLPGEPTEFDVFVSRKIGTVKSGNEFGVTALQAALVMVANDVDNNYDEYKDRLEADYHFTETGKHAFAFTVKIEGERVKS